MVRILFTVLILFLSVSGNAEAQVRKEKTDSVVSSKDRWALRTNALEWLLTIPNLGFEYDLSRSVYNRFSFNVNARFNWNTAHTYATPLVFNVFELRPEFRYYWRQSDRAARPKGNRQRTPKKMKSWRAYYLGWYLNAGTYGFKFGKEGHQGQMLGTGLSIGYGVPLYEYRKCAVDVEFGLALGVAATRYTAFAHNPDGNYYYPLPEKDRNTLHFVPYPVLSELKVAFVLRRTSIDKKYKAVNTEKITARMNRKDEKKIAKEEARQEREAAIEKKVAEKAEKIAAKEGGKDKSEDRPASDRKSKKKDIEKEAVE